LWPQSGGVNGTPGLSMLVQQREIEFALDHDRIT
jgi:hypothetical protein